MAGKHKAFGIYVHITWHTWCRRPFVHREQVPEILESIAEAAHRTGIHVHETAVLSEHVHIVASLRPETTVSSFVRHAKSESARRLNKPGRPFSWARGYFVETLSRNHLSKACAYVARQFQRHPERIPS